MKMFLKKLLSFLLGLLLIALITAALYYVARYIWQGLSTLDPKLATGFVAAGATIVVSVISVLIAKRIEQKTEIANQLRDKKIPIYEELIDFIFDLLRATLLKKEMPSEEKMIDFMSHFTQKLIIWGSDEVILAFYNYRHASSLKQDNKNFNILFYIEDLLLAIRKDLGHKNKNITKGKILGLFINDIQDILAGKIVMTDDPQSELEPKL